MNTTLIHLFARFPNLTPTQRLILCRRRIVNALELIPSGHLNIEAGAYFAVGFAFTSAAYRKDYNYNEYRRYR